MTKENKPKKVAVNSHHPIIQDVSDRPSLIPNSFSQAPDCVYVEPEFGSDRFAARLFGLSRTRIWELRKAGLIRSIVDKKPYHVRGKRLILLASVRDYLLKQESFNNQ